MHKEAYRRREFHHLPSYITVMSFLIDEDLPRSVGDLIWRHGHEAIDISDIGLRGAKDSRIAA